MALDSRFGEVNNFSPTEGSHEMKERRIAIFTRISMLVLLLCIFTAVVSATSIPITSGSAQYGFAISLGDFEMEGPGLSLFQSTPQGPSTIANCEVGAVCDFSIGIGSDAEFCMYCSGMSAGTLGNKTAEFLSPSHDLGFGILFQWQHTDNAGQH